MKGSCISPGTDIGGSIRNPCAQTGIYGMRPTSQTMPTGGHLWYQGGYDGIVCSTGPMVASARDIDLFIRSVMSTNPALTDPYVIPQVWSPPDLKGKKIKVGIMLHNGFVRAVVALHS
jgi:amidase